MLFIATNSVQRARDHEVQIPSKQPSFFAKRQKKKAHCFMTYRTVRIVAELRLRKSTARFAPCSAVSTVVKTTHSCFNLGCRLFALWSPCDIVFITSKVGGSKSHLQTKNKTNRKGWFCFCIRAAKRCVNVGKNSEKHIVKLLDKLVSRINHPSLFSKIAFQQLHKYCSYR